MSFLWFVSSRRKSFFLWKSLIRFYEALSTSNPFNIPYIKLLLFVDKKCETPNNISGICIPLRDCDPLFQMLLKKTNLTLSERNFLRQSQCGVKDKHPEVHF